MSQLRSRRLTCDCRLCLQEEDTINTTELQTKLKDIPVPVSLPQERTSRDVKFVQGAEYLKAPPPPSVNDDYVLWDIDAAGYAFYKALLDGSAGYTGPPVEEELFERIIDKFERAVRADTLPPLPSLETSLGSIVPDPSIIAISYKWWVGRRKQLAMPLVRMLRPPPDPEDPDVVTVAFRPRVQEGARRMRSNNKKTFTLMSQLHDEFKRLATLLELIVRREKLKLEFHRASGDYTEVAHRTLVHRLGRHRIESRAACREEIEEAPPAPQQKPPHVPAKQPLQAHRSNASSQRPRERDHKKRPQAVARKEQVQIRVAGRVEDVRNDEPDSEEEAYTQLLFNVDTNERAELEKQLVWRKRDPPTPTAVPVAAQARAEAPAASAAPAAMATPEAVAISTAAASAASASMENSCAGNSVVALTEVDAGPPQAALGQESQAFIGGRGGRGRLRGYVRVGRGGRIIFDRDGGSYRQYRQSCWTPVLADPQRVANRSEQLLRHILSTGRTCSPSALERHLDPDEAWRQNRPLKIKQGPLLFDFKWLPRPQFVPSQQPKFEQNNGIRAAAPATSKLVNGDSTNGPTRTFENAGGASKRQKVS